MKKPAKKRSGKGSYPWDTCMEDQTLRYGNRQTAAKVCGSIRAKSLRRNPEDVTLTISPAEEAVVTFWQSLHPEVSEKRLKSLVVTARSWGVDTSDTAQRALEELAHSMGWSEGRRGVAEGDISPNRAFVRLGEDLNVDVVSALKEGYADATMEPQKNPIVVRDYDTFCEAVSAAYDNLPLTEPGEIWRWEKLAEHIRRFYNRVASQVDVEFVDGQPYDSAEQMRQEVRRTGKLLISRDYNEHPVFDPETNLMFRTVHDYVVHIAPGESGPDFTQRGEIRAYNLHRRLAPPDTWPALFSEVLAQACYFNARGEFPTQKVAVLRDFDFYRVGLDTEGRKIGAKSKNKKGCGCPVGNPKRKAPRKAPRMAKGINRLVAEALR